MRNRSELDRLQSDNIKSVEVITNPGARYAASTRAVIRITTKKIQGDGFGFDASTTGEYDEKKNFGGFGQLNMNYRKNGLDLGAYALEQSSTSHTIKTYSRRLILTRLGYRRVKTDK